MQELTRAEESAVHIICMYYMYSVCTHNKLTRVDAGRKCQALNPSHSKNEGMPHGGEEGEARAQYHSEKGKGGCLLRDP